MEAASPFDEPRVWADAVHRLLGAESMDAEAFIRAEHRVSFTSGRLGAEDVLSVGTEVFACLIHDDGSQRKIRGCWLSSPSDLKRALAQAPLKQFPSSGAAFPVAAAPVSWNPPPTGTEIVQTANDVRARLQRLPQPVVIQALLSTGLAGWVLSARGSCQNFDTFANATCLARIETDAGGVVDGVGAATFGPLDVAPCTERLGASLDLLSRSERVQPDPGVPWVFRPLVAAPVVAALGDLLRARAHGRPALAGMLGKKVFPSAVTVMDDPQHPSGLMRRHFDDEGQVAHRYVLVREGILQALPDRLGQGIREPPNDIRPGSFNLFLEPGDAVLPGNYEELTTRIETFSTSFRPGSVSIVVAGWSVREGRRVRPLAPREIQISALDFLRRVTAVGSDLTFIPMHGVGTPSLMLSPSGAL